MTREELMEVRGGISWGLLGLGGGILTFLFGFLEGLTNPIKCGK